MKGSQWELSGTLKTPVSQLVIESCPWEIFFRNLLAERAELEVSCIKKCWFLRFGQYLSSRFLHYSLTVFWSSLRVLDFSACSPEVRTLGNFLGTKETCKNLELKYCPNLKKWFSWWNVIETPLSPQGGSERKFPRSNYRLPTLKLIFLKVPESSHWEPSICSAEFESWLGAFQFEYQLVA